MVPLLAEAQSGDCRAVEVIATEGQVEARGSDGVSFAVDQGQWLCPATLVRTGSDGKVVVRYADKNTTLRLNHDAEIVLQPAASEDDASLVSGILHFISSVRTRFSVQTRFLTAGIDGTEALVHVVPDQGTVVAVREGVVTARQGDTAVPVPGHRVAFGAPAGAVRLVGAEDAGSLPPVFRAYVLNFDGQVDWAIYYPPALLLSVPASNPAAALAAEGRIDAALEALHCGAADEAPEGAALCLLGAVKHNRMTEVERRLADPRPDDGAWQLAASYGYQLRGQLRAAETAARAGLALRPDDGFAKARLAEVLLLRGAVRQALDVLPPAGADCGPQALVEAMTGFALLADRHGRAALARFDCAVKRDGGLPLARLGRGLALIRLGRVPEGRAELENAASLDPRRGSLRTALGRAYFDEGLPKKAVAQFDLARAENPDDPEADLLTALERFAANDPIAALHAISAASAKSSARAPIRDRRGLDEDASVNGTALGRAYDVLGFDQLSRRTASQAVEQDPSNPGAHRFLAESYLGQPGLEVARTSEALQADLFSGPSKAPIQSELGEVQLGLLDSIGPSRVTFREFGPLYDGNGVRFDASGLAGTQQRYGGEASVSGLHDGISIAAGQFYLTDDGFHTNNDQEEKITALQVRVAPSAALSVFGEFRYRESDTGDLTEDLLTGTSDLRVHQDDRRARLGVKISPTADLDVVALVTYRDRSLNQSQPSASKTLSDLDEHGGQFQVRGDWRPLDGLTLIAGGETGRTEADSAGSIEVRLTPFPPPFPPIIRRAALFDYQDETKQATGYAYAYWSPMAWLDVTAGLAYSHYDQEIEGGAALERDTIAPKLGVEVRPVPDVTLRAAVFQAVKHRLLFDQTLEPTTVAGFNQLFQDPNGTRSTTYGIGADWKARPWLWVGGEASWRDIDRPVLTFVGSTPNGFRSEDWKESNLRGYVGATFGPRFSATLGGQFQRLNRDTNLSGNERLDTILVPASVRWFHPSGVFAAAEAIYYNQDLRLRASGGGVSTADSQGVVVNLAAGLRLPNQRGALSLEVRNLLDRNVRYEEPTYRTGDVGNRQLARGLAVTARATLSF
ncbi:MAG: FecR domain-containing protein [Alphaproteobacteria bacterium]|nr:FecR domain-containing protein [Alphaproteobacteria bacterium]MCB9931499.1 FecR domain-containing protein [Alphaproteobacteria bacterium]